MASAQDGGLGGCSCGCGAGSGKARRGLCARLATPPPRAPDQVSRMGLVPGCWAHFLWFGPGRGRPELLERSTSRC